LSPVDFVLVFFVEVGVVVVVVVVVVVDDLIITSLRSRPSSLQR
jgi:hypothetical protein